MKTRKIWDGTVPSADNGLDFDASIGAEPIISKGPFLDRLHLGLFGDVSTAAVVIETFANELSEYILEIDGETRIKMDAQDLCALMVAFYGRAPSIQENTDGTGHDFLQDIEIPIQAPHGKDVTISHAATNEGQTNITNTEINLYGEWHENAGDKKPIIAVKINLTTAASAGWDLRDLRIAAQGNLRGILIRQANPYSDANSDISVQRVTLLEDGVVHSEFHALSCMSLKIPLLYTDDDPLTSLLKNYSFIDLSDEPIDGTAKELKLQLDVQDVSDTVDIIPIIEKTK